MAAAIGFALIPVIVVAMIALDAARAAGRPHRKEAVTRQRK